MQVNDLRFFERESFASATVSKIANAALRVEGGLALKKTAAAIKEQNIQVAAIEAEAILSPTGKQQELKRVRAKFADDVKSAGRFLNSIDKRVVELEAEMVFPEPENEVLHYLKMQEVRTMLNQKTPQEISLAYERAMRVGDYNVTIEALETSPIPYGFVTEESRAVNHRTRLHKAFTESFAEIETLQEATKAVRRLGELL